MADAKLEILLTADSSSLSAETNKATSQIKILETQLQRLQKIASLPDLNFRQQERLNAMLLTTQRELDKSKRAFDLVNPSVNRFTQSSNAATQASINFGRVIQDAPYGFLGIANNLNPLLESFQRLKTETGSAGAAFRSLGSSLIGPAGVGLAVSAVSSLLILFGGRLFGASKAAKEADDANKKLAEGVSSELAKLTVLVGVIQNVNTKYDDRAKAIKFVNQEYGELLKSMGIEKVTAENIALAYDKITESLIRQAVVKGIQDQISKSVEETAKKVVALQISEEKHRLAQEKANSETKNVISNQDAAIKGYQRYNQTIKDGVIAQQSVNAEQKAALGSVNNYESRIKSLTDSLKAQLAPLLNLTSNFEDLNLHLNKPTKAPKVDIDDDFFKQKLDKPIRIEADLLIDKNFVADNRVDLPDETRIKELFKIEGRPIPIPLRLNLTPLTEEGQAQIDAIKAAQSLGEDTAKAFNDGLQAISIGSITSFAEGIGEAFSGGDVRNAFQGFVNAIGSGIQAIGKQLIVLGATALLAKEALKKLFTNPALAIAAGIGLVAVGSAFKSVLSKGLPGRASGGPVSKDKPYLVGETGREVFFPNQSGSILSNSGLKNLLGGFAGQSINALQRYPGGSMLDLALSHQPTTERFLYSRGTDVWMQIQRTQKHIKRHS